VFYVKQKIIFANKAVIIFGSRLINSPLTGQNAERHLTGKALV
jgi:hypothetical protein